MKAKFIRSTRARLLAAILTIAGGALFLAGCDNANVGKPSPGAPASTGPVQVALQDGSSLGGRLNQLEESINKASQTYMEQTKKMVSQQRLIDFESMPTPVRLFDLSSLETVAVTGPEDAVVTLIEFSDFQCPYCSRMAKFLEEMMEKKPGKIRLIFVDRPLDNQYRDGYPFHPYAMTAHEAAAEAKAQGKFWEMYNYIFENQQKIFPAGRPKSQEDYDQNLAAFRETLSKAAGELGLDQAKMKTALEQRTHQAQVERNNQMAQSMGVNSTPTVYVNAFMSMGSPNMVLKLIDEAGKIE